MTAGSKADGAPKRVPLADQLRAELATGRFAPGQRLVEADLTERFQASRTRVREALQHLAAEGYVEHLPNRGSRVRRLSRRDVRQIYELREVVEGLAARRAALGIGDPDLRHGLHALWAEMEMAARTGDVARYLPLNTRLHDRLIRADGSVYLQAAAERLRVPILRLQFEVLMTTPNLQLSHDQHAEILSAIEAGHGEGAEIAMRKHLRSSFEAVWALPDELFDR
ncbi:MAG: GntR family transcriptional regulator [Methylobacteriaceae bacterium]|nr:GntR family transcriptional regulator [Methylobacteriaceae bacterium]